jgi:hypothetical protein
MRNSQIIAAQHAIASRCWSWQFKMVSRFSMVRFSDALSAAQRWFQSHRDDIPTGAVLVRDLFGRIRIALPPAEPSAFPSAWLTELHATLGAYSPGPENILLLGQDMMAPDAIFAAPDLSPIDPDKPTGLRLLDRVVTGADWLRSQFANQPPCPARATFYGLKGGVGRSTALALFARHLAAQGKRVLVLDLDLESPGVGSLLLPGEKFPSAGLVDWFVEDAVGQADEGLLEHLTAASPLSSDLPGEIRIAPAHGYNEAAYIPKLSRVTLDVRRGANIEHFADRLNRLIEALETKLKPDAVLLDSRAGLHDVAAIALTRLRATAFLFAAHGDQTWQGYRLLFRHWQTHHEVLPAFRDNIRMVDALVPEQFRTEHRAAALAAAYTLFEETIYEESAAESTAEAFNFDMNDLEAPHHSLPIYWRGIFQGYNPVEARNAVSDAEVQASYGQFLRPAERLLFGSAES